MDGDRVGSYLAYCLLIPEEVWSLRGLLFGVGVGGFHCECFRAAGGI